MPEPVTTTAILGQFGVLLGGILVGVAGSKKLPWFRNGNGNNGKSKNIEQFKISEKTGGAMRISEEALHKLDALTNDLENNYLTEKLHIEFCGKQGADMKLHVSNLLNDHTKEIIREINSLKG